MIYSILINTKKPWNIVPWLLLCVGGDDEKNK